MFRLERIAEKLTDKNESFIYSVPCTPKKKGETPIYRKPSQKNGLLQIPDHLKSLADVWDKSVWQFPNNKCCEDFTYTEIDRKMKRVGSWMKDQGHQLAYLYCKNSVEWSIVDLACWNYGMTNVPLYDTLGEQAFFHILKLTEGTLMFATMDMFPSILKNLQKSKEKVRQIIFFDHIPSEKKELLKKIGVRAGDFTELLQFPMVLPRPKLSLDTLLTINFTSGTTGIPKGVVGRHRQAVAQILAVIGHLQYRKTDTHFSFLPIAHVFERFITWSVLERGGCIRYAKHPTTQILKDLATIRPTVMPIVPRLLNKFYPVCKAIYEKEGSYAKIKGMFGGKLRMMVTGSAPVSPEILKFFHEALKIDLREGYGQTETTAASFITYEGDTNYGYVGGVNSVTEFKLADVPEMNYTSDSNPPKGQVCMRGDSIFKQYYKDEKNTKQTIDEEGWNHTGDIGVILPNGALKIVDRKKNIFKLSQGEYIAPQKVENVYVRCKYVAEAFLYGDSLRDFNVAFVHPNLELLPFVAKQVGVTEKDVKKLCQNPKIVNFILKEMNQQGKHDGLFGFEMAKRLMLWPESFQVIGIVTSTMKLQRHQAKKVFLKQIQQLYQQK